MAADIFFLLSTARSGTTWLGSLLASHPDIQMEGEILNPDIGGGMFYQHLAETLTRCPGSWDPTQHVPIFQDYVASVAHASTRSKVIFDLKLEQLFYMPALEAAVFQPWNKFIHLKRINILKQTVSEAIMIHRHARDPSSAASIHSSERPPQPRISLDPSTILTAMRLKHRILNAAVENISTAGVSHISLLYEELTGGYQKHFLDGVLDYLGVSRMELKSPLVKQNTDPLWKILSNWHDVYSRIRQSEFDYTLFLPE